VRPAVVCRQATLMASYECAFAQAQEGCPEEFVSTFEFISVLLSIVVGLALTRLLSGFGRALELRRNLKFFWIQGVWAANIALALVVFWWATLFSHVEHEVWLFSNFALLLSYSVLLFLQAVLIIPTDLAKSTDLEDHFFSVRPWFFSIGVLVALAELGDTFLHGGIGRILEFGPQYISLVTFGVVLNLVGARTKNPWFHGVFCLAYFFGVVAWILVRFSEIG